MEQNYFMVNELSVVDNIIVWNGDLNIWQPPAGYTMLIQATTPAMNWELDESLTPPDYVLREIGRGVGGIGYTWDGTVLTTDKPKPEVVSTPKPLPTN